MRPASKTQEQTQQHQNYKNFTTDGNQGDHHFIGDYEKAPQFMKDNAEITHGYRINFNTPARLFKSLFMVHNESVNIWTHCLPLLFLIFVLASFWLVIDSHQFRNTFSQYRAEVQQSLHQYHGTLKNLSQFEKMSGKEQQKEKELLEMKHTILDSYRQMISNLDKKSLKIKELLEYNIEGIKSHIHDELKTKLAQFQKSKYEFQYHVAPKIVEAIQHTFNGTFINIARDHVEKLKNHMDSNIFQIMELHEQTPNPQHISRWPIFVFLITAVICLLCSTLFHLFHPLSVKTYGLLLRFDFAGISLLISGSAFPPFYYGMYCQMAMASIYLTISIAAALICFVVCLFEWIHKQGNERYRSMIFGTFGTLHLIPLSHLVINQVAFNNYGDSFEFSSSVIYYVMLTVCYMTGLYVFTVRCPQRNNPGRYNICGHSHQIWHCFVVLGIFFTYLGALQNFEMRKHSMCPA